MKNFHPRSSKQNQARSSTQLTLITFRSSRSSWSLALRRANLLILFWSSLRTSVVTSSSAGVILILGNYTIFVQSLSDLNSILYSNCRCESSQTSEQRNTCNAVDHSTNIICCCCLFTIKYYGIRRYFLCLFCKFCKHADQSSVLSYLPYIPYGRTQRFCSDNKKCSQIYYCWWELSTCVFDFCDYGNIIPDIYYYSHYSREVPPQRITAYSTSFLSTKKGRMCLNLPKTDRRRLRLLASGCSMKFPDLAIKGGFLGVGTLQNFFTL